MIIDGSTGGFGRNDYVVSLNDSVWEDMVDFSNVRLCGNVEFTGNIVRGTLDLRDSDITDCGPPDLVQPVSIDLRSTVVVGTILLNPVFRLDVKGVRYLVAGLSFSDTDAPWERIVRFLDLGVPTQQGRAATVGRFESVYRATGRRSDLRDIEPYIRELTATWWGLRLWNHLDKALTGYGYKLYRIPISVVVLTGVFAVGFAWFGRAKRKGIGIGVPRYLATAAVLSLRSFWGSKVEDGDVLLCKSLADGLGKGPKVCRACGVAALWLYSFLIGRYLGR